MAKCQLFFKAVKKSKKKLKSLLYTPPAGLFSGTRQRYNALQRFFRNIYLPKKGKKKPLSFLLKFVWYNKMLKPTKRSQGSRNFYNNVCFRFFLISL